MKTRQNKFFEKMITSRAEMIDDPLMHAISITREHNKPMWSYIQNVLNGDADHFVDAETKTMKDDVQNAPPSGTRFRTYFSLNPTLEVHPIYTDCSMTIPDYLRISFTRFRLSSRCG